MRTETVFRAFHSGALAGAGRSAAAAAVVGLVLALFSQALPAAERTDGPEPGDLIQVTVYGQPDLDTTARVSRDNTISFPFIGQVTVGGVSTAEAQRNIARQLEQQGIVRNPQVTVLVEEPGAISGDFVTVLGQVNAPGRYSLGEESQMGTTTLLDLLAVAGGTTETANSKIILFRNGTSEDDESRMEVDIDAILRSGRISENNVTLSRGDVVIVPEEDVFYIYGQVQRPGRYPLEKNMMVMQAISVGGGVTERGNDDGIVLTRREDGEERQLNAELNDELVPGDVIYVKERFF